jgi:acetoin utilization deacetylase AcuC-like enzyme
MVAADSGSPSPSTGKPKAVLAAWEREGLPIELRPVLPVELDDFGLAHEPAFVRGVMAGEIDNGFRNRRADIARTLPYTSGAMLGAASYALQYGVACAPVSGFHHAGYDHAAGFCTFNGLMVSALRLISDGRARRIMILDCDQHFGDGTDDIIARLKVQGVDNVSFGRWFCTSPQAGRYMERLDIEVQRFGEFDLILYQAGADVHVDDPLGGVLTTEQMRHRDRIVFEAARDAGVPIAWNLAGGYQEPLAKVVALHVNTMRECIKAYG